MKFDYLVFIGRFQPFHFGHKVVVDHALTQAKHVIMLLGSANLARSLRNPFLFQERADMIAACYPEEVAQGRLILHPAKDVTYNDIAWVSAIQRNVAQIIQHNEKNDIKKIRIGLIGRSKDNSSYYLKKFPEWGSVDVLPDGTFLNATDIRTTYFTPKPELPKDTCPPAVGKWLAAHQKTAAFAQILEEAAYVNEYKQQWASAPYPPIFVTVDAIVIQSGHILLIRRKSSPGKGLLALPGGFVDQEEPIRDAAIRELREETKIADHKGHIPPAMLSSFIEDSKTRIFDDPYRSSRGRTITHAYLFSCPDKRNLFNVKGSDDAEHADWYRLSELEPQEFFEDHWFILQEMLGSLI